MSRRSVLPSWREMPLGGRLEAGSAKRYTTGTWRTEHPVFTADDCSHCMLCWLYCPDGSVLVTGGKVTGIDYTYCKGCGLCVQVCPRKPPSIEMRRGPGPVAAGAEVLE